MIQRIGKYRILGQIGRGGMGTVYRAHDPILDRTVALKVISSEADLTDELRARFFREAQACAKLSHPNIITVHDLGEEDGHLFIVMEYLEGEELKQVIAQRRPLTLEAKLQIMVQICAGLEYAHQKGVIHRDIKPGNIFVLRSGAAKILDFGIARIASEATGLTRTGLIMGTLRYMSPEQARGQVDHRSDIFSAGAVFYELLTSRVPFAGEDAIQILEQLRSHDPVPIVELDPALPAELGAAIHRALRKDPADRFPGFGELRIELDRVRRKLEEHSGALRSRLRERVDEVGQLRQTWAERAGAPPPADPGPALDEPASLTAIEARYRDLSAEADQLVQMVRRAEALEPELQSALARLEQGDAEGAARMLLPIVQGLPEHARAAEALARAQGQVEEQRRARERVHALLAEAEADFEGGAYARCLERLGALAGPAGADLGERVEG
ncbi:MAG TPA: serine/threonine-protein kinase, partial [Candidatus Binatia bacterium]|nr:serine/threonine-protein kinase [Candidatus Binatia bacterium]